MLTAEQRIERMKYVCSSDAPPVVKGRSRYGVTAADIYWSKQPEFQVPDRATSSQNAGSYIEPSIVRWCADYLGVKPIPDQMVICKAGQGAGILAANLDAMIEGRPREAIEAKMRAPDEEWGEEGSDQIPDDEMIQCQHQIAVADLDRVWVPVLIGGWHPSFRLYCVERNQELINIIVERELEFWNTFVLPKVPPDLSAPPLAALKALRREPNKTVELPPEALAIWNDYRVCRDAESRLKQDADKRYAELLAMLGDAEAGTLPDGNTLTYFAQNSVPACDWKLLRAQQPAIYDAFVTQGQHRVLRLKESKENRAAKKAAAKEITHG